MGLWAMSLPVTLRGALWLCMSICVLLAHVGVELRVPLGPVKPHVRLQVSVCVSGACVSVSPERPGCVCPVRGVSVWWFVDVCVCVYLRCACSSLCLCGCELHVSLRAFVCCVWSFYVHISIHVYVFAHMSVVLCVWE